MRPAPEDTPYTMKYALLLLAVAGTALALTEYTGPVPQLSHKPFGFGGQATGGSTNTSAVYVVSSAAELREAVALPYAKTIYVNGTIQGNQRPDGTLATCQDYIDTTGSPGAAVHGFNFETYLLSLNATYIALVEQAIADNTTFDGRNATEYRTLLGHQNGYRPVVAATQKAQVGFKLTNNTSLIGLDGNAALNGINLYLSSVDNIWIRNLKLVPPQDCFPAPETFPSSWNALYDAVGLVTASNVWVDNCELQDQLSGEYVEPDIIEPGWQVDRFDGLFDCEDGTDNVTFSHNIVRNHHKSMLLGGGTKEADRDLGKMRFTIFGNYFNGSASRNPTMRFGSFDIFSNIYEARNDKSPRFGDAGQAHRREALDATPLDAVFQYHLGVYNQSRVQVQDNVFLQYGAVPNDTSRIFTISEATLPNRPAQVCIRETAPHFPSTMNGGVIPSLVQVMTNTVDFFVESGGAVDGAVVLTCDGFGGYELPKVFEGPGDVLEYVLSEAGQVR
ncbi:polysaccharide lyase 1 family protein [Pleurotus pulmonarius]